MIVPGHGVIAEGAPHTAQACQQWPCDTIAGVQRVNRIGQLASNGVGGHGHALCACGWTGSHAYSGAQRRRDHAEHKRRIAALA